MKIFIQFGNKGASLINHLINPLSMVDGISKILVVCRYPGPMIPKVEYHCPPGFVAKFTYIAVIYEFIDLLRLAFFGGSGCLVGFLLNPHGLIAFIVAKLTRKPIIISLIAGPFELYSRKKPLGVNFTQPLSRGGKWLLKVLNKSDAVITTGLFTKDFLVKQGVKESKIYPMINPPNKTIFRPSDVPKAFDVVSIGRLVPVKHHEIMIQAVSKVKEQYPCIKVCIVGDGPCKNKLMKLTDNLGLRENVNFAGFQKDTSYYYNGARIFVHTSEREGFPNTFMEAMLCGLPCVVSNCGDIIDVVKDGYNAILIQDFSDVDRFAQAILSLLENNELYQLISQNALQTMESLSSEKVANQWKILFSMIKYYQ